MPRYLVERSFPGGLALSVDEPGAQACRDVVRSNAELGVTWLHSYVTEDRETSYCIYDGPNVEAVIEAAAASRLPVDRVTPVSVLDPYFYR